MELRSHCQASEVCEEKQFCLPACIDWLLAAHTQTIPEPRALLPCVLCSPQLCLSCQVLWAKKANNSFGGGHHQKRALTQQRGEGMQTCPSCPNLSRGPRQHSALHPSSSRLHTILSCSHLEERQEKNNCERQNTKDADIDTRAEASGRQTFVFSRNQELKLPCKLQLVL